MPQPSAEQREQYRLLVEAARDGRLPWLATLLAEAGYLHAAERFLVSAKELGLLCGVTPRTLTRWEDKGLPVPDPGTRRWELGGVLRWALAQGKQAVGAELDRKRAAEITRLERQSEKLRLETQILDSKHLPADEIEATTTAAIYQLRAKLLGLGAEIAGGDVDLQRRIDGPIADALTALADEWAACKE